MPASSVNLYHMQDAKNNFNAVRPIPVCDESNYYTTPNHNIHISTNCYYGYHELKAVKHVEEFQDCEMKEVNTNEQVMDESRSNCTARKRGADDYTYTQNKRLRKEDMVPPTSNYNPCLLRPTHNNPDISRCLMVHMI
ncbi:uncharacterized protein LOC121729160 isoform X2 [Aricia agestis]|uniref:uncharacterized protein LOC121729160 isoform X2 n=1 Tax=Aricia agestis TaxID=91739 RepID=UPI001C205C0E|nr:uncharacterized protein LOC121729160 isoform X2 [Aricia agestis]